MFVSKRSDPVVCGSGHTLRGEKFDALFSGNTCFTTKLAHGLSDVSADGAGASVCFETCVILLKFFGAHLIGIGNRRLGKRYRFFIFIYTPPLRNFVKRLPLPDSAAQKEHNDQQRDSEFSFAVDPGRHSGLKVAPENAPVKKQMKNRKDDKQ